MRLSVSRDFFIQFAKRTWLSPYSIVNEMVEDAYDEDATRVIVTVSEGYVVVEDDAGMDEGGVGRFLTVGSTHKQLEPVSPRFGRPRTGRYGVGRLSFLAFFDAMKVKTRKGSFTAGFAIDEECLAGLASGQSEVKVLQEPPMERDGSEIWLLKPRSKVSVERIIENLRGLPALREPFFEVWLRVGEFRPWSLDGAERVKPREVMGEKIPFTLEGGISGEITIAYRPLTEGERGILILHGGHAVTRSSFGLTPSELSRITGHVRCDWIATRFADKAAVIEDDAYERLQKAVRRFLVEEVLPRAVQVERGMTYEESRIFAEVDRLLSRVVAAERVEEPIFQPPQQRPEQQPQQQPERQPALQQPAPFEPAFEPALQQPAPQPALGEARQPPQAPQEAPEPPQVLPPVVLPMTPLTVEPPRREAQKTTVLKPLRRQVSLSRLGFKAVPYDDEADEREYFVEGDVIYVNRGHPAYRKELKMGREVLRRHVLRIVASALAQNAYPESEALEYANRLIAEAIAQL